MEKNKETVLLDKEQWNRKEIFDFYSVISDPFYMVSFCLDVTGIYDYVHVHGLSFYLSLTWLFTKAFNETPAFLVALKGNRLVRLAQRDPSFTYLKKDHELFQIVTVPYIEDMKEFCMNASKAAEAQDCFIDMAKETDELIYVTSLPWIEMTAKTDERDLNDPKAKDDSVPRISWGRFREENGRKILVISLEVNHRFIDGLDIGRFAQRAQELIESLG